jgi:hypothetical protein
VGFKECQGDFYKKDDLRLFLLGIFSVSQLFKSLLSCCTVLLLIRYIYTSIGEGF